MEIKNAAIRLAKGAGIGVGMVIPGISGGTIAVLLGIYEPLIYAINNLKKEFRKSICYLLPILLGMIAGFAAMYYPLKLALQYYPFQTICLFAGLMIGTCPKLIQKSLQGSFQKIDILSLLIPSLFVIRICFIPNLSNVDLGSGMTFWSYMILLLVGILASVALVVPGVSGSMLLLLLGYYQPLLGMISGLRTDFLHSFLVLLAFAIGLLIGFFSIARLMKVILSRFPRTADWAIVSFVLSSVVAIFLIFDYSGIAINAAWILSSIGLLLAGLLLSFFLTWFISKKAKEGNV